MNGLIYGLAFSAMTLTSSLSFAAELNIHDIVNKDKVYQCNVLSDGELTYVGEGKIVIDENVVIEEKSGKQFSTARVVFDNAERRLLGAPITMNLFHVPENGNIKNLQIGFSREIHLRHRNLESYETWTSKRSQVLADNTIMLNEGEETAKIQFSKYSGEVEKFQTRQVLKDRVLFGLIPRSISDFSITCVSAQ